MRSEQGRGSEPGGPEQKQEYRSQTQRSITGILEEVLQGQSLAGSGKVLYLSHKGLVIPLAIGFLGSPTGNPMGGHRLGRDYFVAQKPKPLPTSLEDLASSPRGLDSEDAF